MGNGTQTNRTPIGEPAPDPVEPLRRRLYADVGRIAAETGRDEVAVLALFAQRLERAIPAARTPEVAVGLGQLRAEVDELIGRRLARP